MNPLISKLVRAFGRDRREPLSAIPGRILSNLHAFACATAYLRVCDSIGVRARSFGRPHVDNRGSIFIGDDFAANCRFAAVLLAASPGGELRIGDGVTVNYGTSLTAAKSVRLGHRVMVGPYCIVGDTDAPQLDEDEPSAIVIGDDVWLAGRVTVRPGAHIGDGAVVGAGSVVEGDIPANAVVSGAPARVLRIRRPGEAPPQRGARTIDPGDGPVLRSIQGGA